MAIGRSRASPLISDADIARGIDHLTGVEPRFATIVDRHGPPPIRLVDNALPSLLRIVTEQLISLRAAEAIWTRLVNNLDQLKPEAVLAAGVDGVRAQGLTNAKARCFVALAEAVHHGTLDFKALDAMEDEAARKILLALPGIGPWTAEIYLLAALGRLDACPSGDLALQVALHNLFELDERPNAKTFDLHAEKWRPWRAVASRLLWSYYRGLKGMPQAVT
jgi:DNA-3-methyladenine glycosylase II